MLLRNYFCSRVFWWLFSFQIYISHTFFINRERKMQKCEDPALSMVFILELYEGYIEQAMNLWTDDFMKYNSNFYYNIILIPSWHDFSADLDLALFSCRVTGMYLPTSICCTLWHPSGDQISSYWVQAAPSEISAWMLLLGNGCMIYSQANSLFGLLICLLMVNLVSNFFFLFHVRKRTRKPCEVLFLHWEES